MGVALEIGLEKEVAALGPPVNKRRRNRGNNKAKANAPPKDPYTAIKSVSDPELLSYKNPLSHPEKDIAQSSKGTTTEILNKDVATVEVNIQFSVGSPESGRSSSVPSMVGSPGGIYQPGHEEVCEAKSAELAKELDSLRAQFLDLQVSNKQLSDQVLNLQAQVMGEENIKVAFEEFKKYEEGKVKQQCAEMDTLLDKLSVDFDEELYPYMLTAIYNITLARQMSTGSQLRLRFEQEVRLRKKSRSKIARRDQRIQVREEEIKKLDQEMNGLQNRTKNLKTLLEQMTRKKHPTVLYKTHGLLEKLEQSIFLGGREDISHCRVLAYKRSEGWDASSELVLRGGRDIIGHTSYPYLKITRSPVMPSRAESEMLLGGRRAASNCHCKSCDRYEGCGRGVRILRDTVYHREVTARLYQRRPAPDNYRGGRAEDQVQDEVAYEIPLTGNASAMGVALEIGLEKEVAALGPPVNKRRRNRGNNKAKANAPPKVLRR
nr:hypothetical protein [Tanacetum cinerariifolium]